MRIGVILSFPVTNLKQFGQKLIRQIWESKNQKPLGIVTDCQLNFDNFL